MGFSEYSVFPGSGLAMVELPGFVFGEYLVLLTFGFCFWVFDLLPDCALLVPVGWGLLSFQFLPCNFLALCFVVFCYFLRSRAPCVCGLLFWVLFCSFMLCT